MEKKRLTSKKQNLILLSNYHLQPILWKKKKSFYEEQKSYIPLMALTTHPEKNETNHNNNHNYNYQIMITYVFIPRAMGWIKCPVKMRFANPRKVLTYFLLT